MRFLRYFLIILVVDTLIISVIVYVQIRDRYRSIPSNDVRIENIYSPEGTKIRAKAIANFTKDELTVGESSE